LSTSFNRPGGAATGCEVMTLLVRVVDVLQDIAHQRDD